jgi:hypothetical protein
MRQVAAKILSVDDKKINTEFEKEIAFLKDYEKEIDRQDRMAGESLTRIRDQKLYRLQYKTIEAAIEDRLGWKRAHGYRMIAFVDNLKSLEMSPVGDKLVKELDLKERHVRALVNETDEVEQQVKVLEHIKAHDLPLTAKTITQVADEILPPKTDQPKPKPQPVEAAEPNRDKRTEFDPATFDEGMKADKHESDSTSREAFVKLFDKVKSLVKSLDEGMGPLVRALDACATEGTIGNHKFLLEQHRQLYKHVKDSVSAVGTYSKAWDNSEVR